MSATFKQDEISVRERLNELECLPAKVAQNTQALLPLGGYTGKNLLINGDFSVWQRGNTFPPPLTSLTYTADRWWALASTTGPGINKISLLPGNVTGKLQAIEFNGGASSVNILGQSIEGISDETVTLSFWVKGDSSYAIPFLRFVQNFGTGGSATNTVDTSFDVTTEWTLHSITHTFDSIVGKTIGSDAYTAIHFRNDSVEYQMILSNVQLELGSEFTGFEIVPPAIQMNNCRWYLYPLSLEAEGTPAGRIATGQATSATEAAFSIKTPAMRIRPTLTFNLASNFAVRAATGGHIPLTGLNSLSESTENVIDIEVTVDSGLVAGDATMLTNTGVAAAPLLLDGEIY